MNKKNINLAFFTIAIVGLFSSLTLNIFAQKTEIQQTEQSAPKCLGKLVLPSSVSVNNDAFASYLRVASLPVKERRIAFGEFSNEQKANFFKVQFALQFIKRPNMTKEQKDLILDAISKVSPDFYDKENPEKARLSEEISQELESKAFGIFTPKDASDILAALFAKKDEDVALLQKYEDLLKSGMIMRKRLLKEMPVTDRVNIWKTQLAYHLATGKFSKAQNEFILEMLTSLSPDTFASRANLTKEEEAKTLETLESSIFKVFTVEEAFAIFMAVGIQKIVKDEPVTTNLAPACSCRYYCAGDPSCGNETCVTSNPVCGPFGDWICYRVCG